MLEYPVGDIKCDIEVEICEHVASRFEVRPDEILLEVVPEVVAMVFVEVFLICLENWRPATRPAEYIAPAQVNIFNATEHHQFLPRPCQTVHAAGLSC